MIINIRGANGSGKSTAARAVMAAYATRTPRVGPKRPVERPLGYDLKCPGLRDLFVLGAYETPTGGADTIPSIEAIFDVVRTMAEAGVAVLYEGILAQHSTTRLLELRKAHQDLHVFVLRTPLEVCVASVRQRRADRGDVREFDPKNVEKEWKGVRSMAETARKSGVSVTHVDRDEVVARCLGLLRSEAHDELFDAVRSAPDLARSEP